jgi:hypothetical protein
MKTDLRRNPQLSSLSPRSALATTHGGAAEVASLAALYGLYEVIRGFGGTDFKLARSHTDAIVGLERGAHVFVEHSVQSAAQSVPALPGLLGFAYMTLHFLGTAAALVWIHRSHRAQFALVRTTLMVSTAIALAIYVVYPAAPPRLANLGFADTVTSSAHVNLSSDALGSFYNPLAAVPSLHFGYALIVGVAVAALARRRWVRVLGALYPAAMLFIIVGTGNHFLFDAAAGGLVVVTGGLVARAFVAGGRAPAGSPALSAATC